MVLCIETATTNCSVAIFNGTECIAYKEDSASGYSHNEQLHVFIQEVCRQAEVELSALSAIAVSKGPGSYTGLRIGVSAAKGLCYALSIPLIAIETLSILAGSSQKKADYIIPMIDARRMEVYSCVLAGGGLVIDGAKAEVLSPTSYSEYLERGTVSFIGNGVQKWQTLCQHKNALFQVGVLPSAKNMGFLSQDLFLKNEFVDLAYFEPYYLKDFQSFK